MTKFAMTSLQVLSLLLLSTTSYASTADKSNASCEAWGQYMADTVAPKYMGGGMIMPNLMPEPNMVTGGLGFAWIAPLSEDVRVALKQDRKALEAKYNAIILAQHEMMIEWGKMTEKSMAEGRIGSIYPFSSKLTELSKKHMENLEAFKKAMFAFGNKNNCMSAFESAVALNLYANSQSIEKMYRQLLNAKEAHIKNLKRATDEAINGLEECRQQAPTVAGAQRINKIINKVENTVTPKLDGDCPDCLFPGSARNSF